MQVEACGLRVQDCGLTVSACSTRYPCEHAAEPHRVLGELVWHMWVVVKIMVRNIVRHLIFRVPKKGP